MPDADKPTLPKPNGPARSFLRSLRDRDQPLGQAIRFLAIGAFGTAVNFGVFVTALAGELHYVAASFLGWGVALVAGFCLNRTLTFRSAGGIAGEFARTLVVYFVQQIFMVAALAFAVDVLRIQPQPAFFLALPLAVAISFFGMRLFVFRGRATRAPTENAGKGGLSSSEKGESA